MKYTYAQLQSLWIQAGGSAASAPMAAAIAMAESGGNSTATNTAGNSAGTDRGLWQINSAYHSEVSNACAFDPVCNAKAALTISGRGSNWQPWSTFGNGAFRQFLGGAQTAALPAGTGAGVTAGTSIGSSSTPILGSLFTPSSAQHTNPLLYSAVWIGALATAVFLLYTGLNTSTHGAVSRTASKAQTKVAAKAMVE